MREKQQEMTGETGIDARRLFPFLSCSPSQLSGWDDERAKQREQTETEQKSRRAVREHPQNCRQRTEERRCSPRPGRTRVVWHLAQAGGNEEEEEVAEDNESEEKDERRPKMKRTEERKEEGDEGELEGTEEGDAGEKTSEEEEAGGGVRESVHSKARAQPTSSAVGV